MKKIKSIIMYFPNKEKTITVGETVDGYGKVTAIYLFKGYITVMSDTPDKFNIYEYVWYCVPCSVTFFTMDEMKNFSDFEKL